MTEINSLSDESLRKLAALLRQSGYAATPTSSLRNAQIVDDSYDTELWGYTVGPATAASEADGVMTPGEGVLQVHRRKSGTDYTSTAEFIEFQNFGGEIEDGVWLSIKRDRAARRWVTKEPSAASGSSYTSEIGTVDFCSFPDPIPDALLLTWSCDSPSFSGSAPVVFDDSGTPGWLASDDSVPFGQHPTNGSVAATDILSVHVLCHGTERLSVFVYDVANQGGSVTNRMFAPFDQDLRPDLESSHTFYPGTGNEFTVTYTLTELDSHRQGYLRWNTAAGWTGENPTLDEGDVGFETDTGKYKIGGEEVAWNDLDYSSADADVAAADITDATAAGQAILTAADNAAIRTLLNVEDGATADQTGAEIKAAYEGEANTNAFTDAEKTLLGNQSGTNTGDQDISGIATNAGNISTNTAAIALNTAKVTANTANVQAAGALMDSELTNESAVKAFNPSANGTSLVSAANYAAMRGLLDLEAGTDFYSKASADSTFLQNITGENLTDLSDVDTDKSKTPSDGDVLTFDGTDWNAETPAASGGTANGYMLYQDQKSDGTAGGSSVANTWTARELNTEVADTNGNGSLSSNQITLDAGTYLYRAWAPFLDVQDVRLRLYNATDATVIELGDGCAYSASTGDATSVQIVGRFTIAASKAIELQYYADLVQASNGLGFHDGLALGVEKYARIELIKIEASDAQEYILIQDQKSDGTDGGSSTATTWTARELNTEVYDTGNNCSLSSNQFTLNAGTYRYTASAPFLNSQDVRLRLYNVTDAAEVSGSLSDGGYSASTGDAIRVEATGRFTIASAKAFELQYYLDNAQATIGLGFDDGQTLGVEKYSRIELIKEG